MSFLKEWKQYVKKEEVDFSSFEVQDQLNPNFWHNNKLSPEISQRLKRIVQNFISNLDKPIKVLDIKFTGSLANFNWSKFSDVDLHIVVDFSKVDENEELVKDYFDQKRINWNKTHNIMVKDHEVEIYVENQGEPHISSGVYSILHDKWLVEPQKQDPQVNWDEAELKAENIMKEINEVLRLYQNEEYQEAYDYADKLKERIRRFRKCGLDKRGEFSPENIAFKVLRRNGYLERLSDLKNFAYDKQMSLDEAEGGISSDAQMATYLPDDPMGFTNLRDGLLDEFPNITLSMYFDREKHILRISKIVVPQEYRGQGIGSEIMDRIVDWADHIGATILLTPSVDFGATSVGRLVRFYKRFGFVENKGRKKDFRYSELMYRTPQ